MPGAIQREGWSLIIFIAMIAGAAGGLVALALAAAWRLL